MNGNFKVKCVKTDVRWFTSGKIYEIKNGKFIDDDGEEFPITDRLENITEWRCYASSSTWELIEEPKPYTIVKQDKYEVGDKVKIISERPVGASWGIGMDKWLGEIMTIRCNKYPYEMKEDAMECAANDNAYSGWNWYDPSIEGKVIETTCREVSRPAKVGEWIKSIINYCDGAVNKGDIKQVKAVYGNDGIGVVGNISKALGDGFWCLGIQQYIVLESYQPEDKPINKPLSEYTNKEIAEELLRRYTE